jgi:hypothetical protein
LTEEEDDDFQAAYEIRNKIWKAAKKVVKKIGREDPEFLDDIRSVIGSQLADYMRAHNYYGNAIKKGEKDAVQLVESALVGFSNGMAKVVFGDDFDEE